MRHIWWDVSARWASGKGTDVRACRHCGATGDEATLAEYLEMLRVCNNCRVDIALKGQWNGVGFPLFKRIHERFADEITRKTVRQED